MSDRGETAEKLREQFVHEAPGVILLLRRYGWPHDLAIEALHEAYLRLDRLLRDKSLPRVPLRQYMLGAARSYISHQRQHESRIDRNEALLWVAIDPQPDPESRAISKAQSQQLREAIGALKKPYREIFEKLLEESMSLAEIARKLGIPLQSVYVMYSRGLKRLKKLLQHV